MSLESVFRLSLIMNMIDNLTGPMAGVTSSVNGTVSKLQKANAALGNMAKTGAVMQEVGSQITGAVLSPVEATFETRRAIGELASLGVKDLGVVEDAARQFSDQWAGTTKLCCAERRTMTALRFIISFFILSQQGLFYKKITFSTHFFRLLIVSLFLFSIILH